MGFCTNELMPDAEHQDRYTYKVMIETGMRGLARLNVACLKPNTATTSTTAKGQTLPPPSAGLWLECSMRPQDW